jgi:hypothetical protein
MKGEKKMQDILSLFQEGMIESLKYLGKDLNFKIEYVFLADIINKDYTSFYGVFKNCADVYFEPWDDQQNIITDPHEIGRLYLELLNTETVENGYLKIYCNCGNTYSGGNLLLKADDILLFDEEFNMLSLEQINELVEKFWYSNNKAEG